MDPVLRCDSCQKILRLKDIHKIGCCPSCGNKRMRELNVFNEEEQDQIIKWGYGDFLKDDFAEVALDE